MNAILKHERSCPLCGAAADQGTATAYSHAQWPMLECGPCSFVYLREAPDYAQLRSDLAWEKTSKAEDERRMAARKVTQKFSKKTRWRFKLLPRRDMVELIIREGRSGDVLDIGCGDGGHMDRLPANVRPFGIEISEVLGTAAQARFKKSGGDAVIAPAIDGLKQLDSRKFEIVTMRSYLEHEAQPLPVLQEVSRILKPGGIAFVKVPNFGCVNRMIAGQTWCGFRFPDHLNYFTPDTLSRMAAKVGFKTHQPFGWRLPTGDNMWAKLERVTA